VILDTADVIVIGFTRVDVCVLVVLLDVHDVDDVDELDDDDDDDDVLAAGGAIDLVSALFDG
jgi:hypothetical protein